MAKVYIVDDDRDIVDSLTIILKSKGHEVASQNDENSVAKNAAGFNADLIILDVIFPENESAGFEMARELKEDKTTKDIPILMLSAVNERGVYPGSFSDKDRDDAWLPVERFVEKPIDPKTLIEKVNELLGT